MPSYPLQLPLSPGPKTGRCFLHTKAAASVSPYTGKVQVYDWGVDLYQIHLEFPPMTRSQARPWIEFLRNMRGLVGTFRYDVGELLADSSVSSGESSGTTFIRTFRFMESLSEWETDDDGRVWVTIDAMEDPAG